MTAPELYAEIERQINNLDNNFFIPSSEVTMALNKAIHKYIQEFYKSFEINEESRKRLKKLVRSTKFTTNDNPPSITNASILVPGLSAYDITIPDELKYTVMELPIIMVRDIPITPKVTPINLDVFTANLSNPYKIPYKSKVWRIEYNGVNNTHTILIPNDYTLTEYLVSYITVPTISDITDSNVNMDDFFNEIYQHELVELVVRMLLQPYQLMNNTGNSDKNDTKDNEQ